MLPTLLCSLRFSFREAGSRRYRPSSSASMVPRILSSLFLVICPSASSCDIPPPSSCTLVLVFVFSRSKAQPHHPPVDGRSSILAAESSLHTGCTEYTPAFDYTYYPRGGGGGGRCQTFFFFFPLFSRPRAGLASSFFGLATNALSTHQLSTTHTIQSVSIERGHKRNLPSFLMGSSEIICSKAGK